MELWIGACNLGIMYGFLALGVFITSRILDFADITVDGTFTTGAAVGAVLLVHGMHPLLAIVLAFVAGMLCGAVTGFIHTRFKIDSLLAGILVMTALYSINLHIMGRSNIPLMNGTTVISLIDSINPGLHSEIWTMIIMTGIMLIFWLITSLFFRTDLGFTLRSTGDNAIMTEAGGVNVDAIKIFGVALANGFVAIAGCFVAQYQGFADIGMGIGTLVIGLASVIMGEAVLKSRSIGVKLLSAVIGAVIYRYMIALALFAGMNPIDLKLITALFVLITLIISRISKKQATRPRKKRRPILPLLIAGALVISGGLYMLLRQGASASSTKQYKIGVVQISQNGILNITRDAFLQEMKRVGFDENTEFLVQSADSDIPTLNTILDNFQSEKCDVILTISTPATQAAINKISNIPIVFATVANPFVFGAGSDEQHHLPNVTGTYGWVPMDQLVDLSQELFPERTVIGTMGNLGEANTEFYLDILRNTVQNTPKLSLVERAITSPNEVYEAAVSIVNQDAEVFILPVDNAVYSSFDAIIKAAAHRKIPIFSSDADRLQDGAMVSYGYDYAGSGIQAAHLVERIIRGENPADIPFERYRKMVFGLNLKVAGEYGITIDTSYIKRADTIVHPDGTVTSKTPEVGLVYFADDPLTETVKKGVYDALADHGYIDGINMELTERSANADFQMINAITQDFLTRDVDIIVPLSTPCLQSALQLVGEGEKPDIVFSFVTDPFAVGAGRDSTHHMQNVTGFSCFPPFGAMLDAIGQTFPQRKTIGVVWNSSEANSQSALQALRKQADLRGYEIVEATVTNPAEVLEASRSLVHKGAEVFLNPGDNTLNTSFESFLKAAEENDIPVVSDSRMHVEVGAALAVGTDFYQNGYDAGEYVARMILGEDAASLPIVPTSKVHMAVNCAVAERHGWQIPAAILNKSDKIGTPEVTRKVAVFHFNEQKNSLDSVDGIISELRRDGFADEQNLQIDRFSAQNEFSIAQSLVQDIVRKQYDYLITVSTPALQAGANFNTTIPHIFGTVTDPYRAGIGTTPTEHRANITGLQTLQPVEATIRTMREIMPDARDVGIVWCSSELCSEVCVEMAREAAEKYGFNLHEVTVTNSVEVLDAVNSLLGKIDIFFTSGDNTVELSLEPIAEILKEKRIPYFTNSPAHLALGSFCSIGADYPEVGRETARVAREVIQGRNPQDIAIRKYAPEALVINLQMAREYAVDVPDSIITSAREVIQ